MIHSSQPDYTFTATEHRLCRAVNGNVNQQSDAAEIPKQEAKEQPDQVHPENIESDVRTLSGEKLARADREVGEVRKTAEQTERTRETLQVENLSPEQKRLMDISMTDSSFRDEERSSFFSLVSKLSPDLCGRLAKEQPLQPEDFRSLAALYPQLSQGEQEVMKALAILPIQTDKGSNTDVGQAIEGLKKAVLNGEREGKQESETKREDERQTPGGKEKEKRQQESAERLGSNGYITDEAWALMNTWGIMQNGGTGNIEKRLAISGNPERVNYMAAGGMLMVEVIPSGGNAQLFLLKESDVRMKNDQEQKNTPESRAARAGVGTPSEASAETQRNEAMDARKIMPASSYATVNVRGLLSDPTAIRSFGSEYVRQMGDLAAAIRQAQEAGLKLEERDGNERILRVVTKDGKTIGSKDRSAEAAHRNDRDAWEQELASMIRKATESQRGEKK